VGENEDGHEAFVESRRRGRGRRNGSGTRLSDEGFKEREHAHVRRRAVLF